MMGGQTGWWTEEQFDMPTKWRFGVFMPITSNKMYLTVTVTVMLRSTISQHYESRGVNYDGLSSASDVRVISEQLMLQALALVNIYSYKTCLYSSCTRACTVYFVKIH